MGGVALVTGASSGLGRGIAEALARRGFAVGLAARRAEELVRIAEAIREEGGRALPLRCDVTVQEEVTEAVCRLEDRFGPVDLLVANAGISGDTPGDRLDAEEVERVFRVNFLGMVYAVDAVLPAMLRRRSGQIVGMSSVAGYRGLPRRPAYSASKAAMTVFLEGLRIDLLGSGVAVTIVSPGWVRTPLTERNPYPMLFLVELDDAVRIVMRGIEKRSRHIAFPLPVVTVVRLLRFLPPAVYDWLGARVLRRIGDR